MPDTGNENTVFAGGSYISAEIDPRYVAELDGWDGTSDTYFHLGTTSDALRSLGAKDKKIVLRSAKIKEVLNKHKGMSLDIFKQVPQVLEYPVMVLNSRSATPENQNRSSRIVIFGEVYDSNGAPVTAVLELRPTLSGGEVQDYNLLVSAYGKNKNLHKMAEESDVLYLDEDKKRTDTWLHGLGLQLPSYETKYGSIGSISYEGGLVNIQGVPWRELTGNRTFQEEVQAQIMGKNSAKEPETDTGKQYSIQGASELQRQVALDEVAADFTERLLVDESMFRRVAQQDRNLAQRLLDSLREFLRKVRSTLSHRQLTELERAEQLWEAALRESVQSGGQATTTQNRIRPGIQYSLKTGRDGKRYVEVDTDQDLFDGLTTSQMQTVARDVIKERFKGRVIGDEYTAYVTKRSAEHYAYPANRRMDDLQKRDKMRASTELDNVIAASKFRENVPDDGRHPEATGGLDKLNTRFEVGGRMYEAEVTALVTDRGRVFYDVTKLKDITEREVGQTRNRTAETLSNASDDSISGETGFVNEKRADSFLNGFGYKAERSENFHSGDIVTEIRSEVKDNSESYMRAFQEEVRAQMMGENSAKEPETDTGKQYSIQGASELQRQVGLDEMAADFTERLLVDESMFRRVAQQDRNLAQRLLDSLREFLRKVRSALSHRQLTELERAEQLWEAALRESVQSASAGSTSEVRYSVNKSFADEISSWDREGRISGESFILGATGDVLQGLGAVENDIYMSGDKVSQILHDHPEMTLEEIKRIPEVLEDPVLILSSKGVGRAGRNSRVVIFGSLKARNGQPVMGVLDLRPIEGRLVIDDMQKVNSAYTKKNAADFVLSSDVLHADKKEPFSFFARWAYSCVPPTFCVTALWEV